MNHLIHRLGLHVRDSIVSVLLIIVLLAVGYSSAPAATTWWVFASASTGGTGTESSPFNTIATAMSHAVSGDTIELEYGSYYEKVNFTQNNITLTTYAGTHAIISGMYGLSAANNSNSNHATTWSQYTGTTYAPSGDVYYTNSVPIKVRALYSTFAKQPIARAPDSSQAWATINTVSSSSGTYTVTLNSNLNLPFNNTNLMSSFVNIFCKSLNYYLSYYITGVSVNGSNQTVITFTGDGSSPDLAAGDRIVVCNHPSLIKYWEDWAYQDNGNGTTNLYWYSTANNQLYAQTNNISYVVTVNSGVSGTNINGVEVTGATYNGIYCYGASNTTIQNCVCHDNGFGYGLNGAGIASRNATNTLVENCEIFSNFTGVTSQSDTDFTLKLSEVSYNENDGVDIFGVLSPAAPNDGPTVEDCYIHHHTSLLHPDDLEFWGGVSSPVIESNYFGLSTQSVDSKDIYNVTMTNNVCLGAGADSVITGSSVTPYSSWSCSNNTYALDYYGALNVSPVGTVSSFSLDKSVYYRALLSYPGATESNSSLLWNNTDPILTSDYSSHYYQYFANPTGSQLGISTLTSNYDVEVGSTGANPEFATIPLTSAQVISGLASTTTTSLVLDAETDGNLTGFFNKGDVVEVDNDGVTRTIQSVSNSSQSHTTITISPALSHRPIRDLAVWDWGNVSWSGNPTTPAIDLSPTTSSPTNYANGTVGSTIDTADYASGKLGGSSTRNVPTPVGVTPTAYAVYPYNGIVP